MTEAATVSAGDFGQRLEIFAAHLVAKTQKNCLFLLGGDSFYDLTLLSPRDYDADFSCVVANVDPQRCKRVVLGKSDCYRLWPLQFVRIVRCRDVWLADPPAQRWKLPGSRTIFVDPHGDDVMNDGMLQVSPLRTPQLAADLIIDQFDINSTYADVRLLDGVYDVPAGEQLINVSKALHGQNKMGVQGNIDEPGRVVVNIPPRSRGFYVEDFGVLVVRGMRLVTSGLGSHGLFVRQFGIGDVGWVQFGQFERSNPITTWNGSVNVIGPVRFDGNAHFMFAANRGGEIDFGAQKIEIANGLSVAQILHAESGGRIHALHATWSDVGGGSPPTVVGQKAYADGRGSQIYVNPATMPGTIKQATENGGQILPAEKDELLAERDRILAEQKELLSQQSRMLAEQKELLAGRDRTLADQRELLAERDRMLADQRELLAGRDRAVAEHEATLVAMRNSRSWRMTAPVRKAMAWLRK